MTDKIKAELSTLIFIQDVMKQDVPGVNKILFSAQEIARFRSQHGDPQLVLTRAIMDKTLEPAYKIIMEKSGGDLMKINSPAFQAEMDATIVTDASLAEKIERMNKIFATMPLNKIGGPTFFGQGNIDVPHETIPSPENYAVYKSIAIAHRDGTPCADLTCKPVDPTKLTQVTEEQLTR